MDSKAVLAYARKLCDDIDGARPVKIGVRRVILPVAVPAALGLSIGLGAPGCVESNPVDEPEAEICDNGIDDNDDGAIDCQDDDCSSLDVCLTAEPGCEPLVEYCEDGVDNNEDGATDCADLCCDAYCFSRDCPGCEYGVPFEPPPEEVDCTDGRDEDCDGRPDCCDPDCADDPSCAE